jgi:class 3 adenylate cyclase
MELKPVVLVLADISGYTRFIRFHRVSLLHAERIIADLLESVMAEATHPLIIHELEGDAVSLYAVAEDRGAAARSALAQVERFFEAFRTREAELVSECSLCECDACKQVGQLKLKAVLHTGDAAFTQVRQFTKVAGEDVILAHRLLKNSVPSDEYVLMTDPFVAACGGLPERGLERRTEQVEGLGEVVVHVQDLRRDGPVQAAERRLLDKLRTFGRLEGYTVKRLFTRPRQTFRHLEPLRHPD